MWKRLLALAAALTVLFSLMVPFAGAADLSGDLQALWIGTYTDGYHLTTSNGSYPVTSDLYLSLPFDEGYDKNFNGLVLTNLYFKGNGALSGSVGVYASFYYTIANNADNMTFSEPMNPLYELRYTNSQGQLGVGTCEYSTFTPRAIHSSQVISKGITLKGKTIADEGEPLSNPYFVRTGSAANFSIYNYNPSGTDSSYIFLRFTNARLVGTANVEELNALEGIADSIAAQSEVLSAMYGDLVSICNSIYQRLGDMQQTQQLAMQYFSTMVSLLNSINSNTSNIYSLLSTQLAALENAITTGAADVVSAIEAQTAALIAYFDALYGVEEVPGSVQDQVNEGASIQQDLDQLKKPDAVTIVPDISGIISDSDVSSYGGILGSVFNVGIVVSMLMISLSLAFVGYVLYGKR